MSHTTAIENIVFNDIAALKLAVKELQSQGVKCSLKEKTTPRAYYANQSGMGHADYVLELQGAPYDVGFYYDKERKGYVAKTDLFAGHVAGVLGAACAPNESREQAALGKLYQTYAIHAATRQAAKQGYSVRRSVKPDGTVQLIMNVG